MRGPSQLPDCRLEDVPPGGVTVCTQAQPGRGECSVVRTAADVEALYAQCKVEARSWPFTTRRGKEVAPEL